MPFKRQGITYGVKHQRKPTGRDAESQSFMGSRYKGPDTTEVDMPNAFDDESWTPYTALESAVNLARLAWVFMALWQLNRHSVFADGVWYGITIGQMCGSLVIAVATFFAVRKNYLEREANLTTKDGKIVTENGEFVWKDPAKIHALPEIRNGLLWTVALAGADATIFYFCYEFWHANIPTPLDCVDQRRSDRNMWIIIIVQTFASVEAIQYFFNFIVYRARKHGGLMMQLTYDL